MMKIKYILGTVVLATAMQSCSDDLLDRINKDQAHPNAEVVNAKLQLTNGEVATVYSVNAGAYAWYVSSYTEQLTGTGNNQMYRVEMRDPIETAGSTTFSNEWNAVYQNLNNLVQLINKCADGGVNAGQNDLLAMGQTLAAFNWGVLTDLHGDVPCSEAFVKQAPKLDKQEDVYKYIFELLDGAIANCDKAIAGKQKNVGGQDLYFANDMKKWRGLAHALKARFKLHTYGRDKAVLSTVLSEANAAVADGFDGATLNQFNGTSADNSWSAYHFSRYYLGNSKTVEDLLVARNDPREAIYNVAGPGGEMILGVPGDEKQAKLVESVSYPKWLDNGAAYLHLFSKAELYFILAEVKARLNQDGSEDFKTAVRASFEDYAAASGVAAGDVESYLNNINALYLQNPLAETMVQKYIAMARDEQIETYNDIRRCNYSDGKYYVKLTNPNNKNSSGANRWPLRLPYGSSDVVSNPNVKAAFGEGNNAGIYIYSKNVWFAGGE